VADAVDGFAAERRSDLWAGVGLAVSYAGGGDTEALTYLQSRAGYHRAALAQGAVFAAAARIEGGNSVPHNDAACRVLCGMTADAASAIPIETRQNFPANSTEPDYEIWRRRIQTRISEYVRLQIRI